MQLPRSSDPVPPPFSPPQACTRSQGPPQNAHHREPDHEAQERDQEPVSPHPENDVHIAAMPTAPLNVLEEAVTIAISAVLGQEANAGDSRAEAGHTAAQKLNPHNGEKERARAVHHGDVGQAPVAVVFR